jgi:hypothetical protein
MTADASRQAVVEAALVLLERMGLTPADLAAVPPPRRHVPTFAEHVPVVSAAVSAGTRRAYGSYWNPGGRALGRPPIGHVYSGHGWPARAGVPVRSCVLGRARAALILVSVRVRGESSRYSGLARRHRWVARLR